MLPKTIFMDLVDAKVPFKVLRLNLNSEATEIGISAAKDGVLVAKFPSGTVTGEADKILNHINAHLLEHDFPGITTFGAPQIFLDDGMIVSFEVRVPVSHADRANVPAVQAFEATLLFGDVPNPNLMETVIEVKQGRKPILLHAFLDPNGFPVELGRLSRHAIDQRLHAKIATAVSWSGTPNAEQSFVALYGDAALEEAIAQSEERQAAFEDAASAALQEMKAGRGR